MTTELQNITAQPSSAKQVAKTTTAPRVLIDQNDLFVNILTNISDSAHVGKVLMLYITSLAKHNIAAQHDISKLIIVDLVRRKQFDTLQKLIKFSLINESKVLACFLLSLSHDHPSVTQMALDMLCKLNAETVSSQCNSLGDIIADLFPLDHHRSAAGARQNCRGASIGQFISGSGKSVGAQVPGSS